MPLVSSHNAANYEQFTPQLLSFCLANIYTQIQCPSLRYHYVVQSDEEFKDVHDLALVALVVIRLYIR